MSEMKDYLRNFYDIDTCPSPIDRRMTKIQELGIRGMNTENIRFTINELVKRFAKTYLEVGSFQGASVISAALYNDDVRCIAIDNFCEFDKGGTNKKILLDNIEKAGVKNIELIDKDYKVAIQELFEKEPDLKVDVYFYDGNHSYENQYDGLNIMKPHLSDSCIIFVDDCNWSRVDAANRKWLSENPDFKNFTIYTNMEKANTWWNGFTVIYRNIDFSKSKDEVEKYKQQVSSFSPSVAKELGHLINSILNRMDTPCKYYGDLLLNIDAEPADNPLDADIFLYDGRYPIEKMYDIIVCPDGHSDIVDMDKYVKMEGVPHCVAYHKKGIMPNDDAESIPGNTRYDNFDDYFKHIQYLNYRFSVGRSILFHSHTHGRNQPNNAGIGPGGYDEWNLEWDLITKLAPNSILEIGCAMGVSTLMFTHLCDNVTVLSNIFYQHFDKVTLGCKFNSKIAGDSKVEMKKLSERGESYDFIFIDGDHSYDGVKADFENALALNPKHILLHDTHNPKFAGIMKFLEELKALNKYQIEEFKTPNGMTLVGI